MILESKQVGGKIYQEKKGLVEFVFKMKWKTKSMLYYVVMGMKGTDRKCFHKSSLNGKETRYQNYAERS